MNKINSSDLAEKEHGSPEGKYKIFRRHISLALGGKKDVGTWSGGHPFDVELVRLPPGARNFPLHQHAAQWEMYLILSGTGEVTNGTVTKPIAGGDSLLFPPDAPHQLTNTGAEDILYYVISDQPMADISYYLETCEWGIKPQAKHFVMTETPYYQPGD